MSEPTTPATGYEGDAMDLYVEASNNIVGLRRHGTRIYLGVTRAMLADLDADDADFVAHNLLAAAALARAAGLPEETQPDA